MEKLEHRKKLEKKRAYMICLMVFLALVTPTILSIARKMNVSTFFQSAVFLGMLVIIVSIYKKARRIKAQLRS